MFCLSMAPIEFSAKNFEENALYNFIFTHTGANITIPIFSVPGINVS